jgi:integrase
MKKKAFPIVFKNGSVAVKVYRTPTHGCDSFTVVYYHNGRRVRKSFSDLETAKTEADLASKKLGTAEAEVLTLTSEDRAAYLRAVRLLAESGVALELAVMQFVEAARVLEGGSLVEAARFYAKHHNARKAAPLTPAVVEEMLAAKAKEGFSERHVADLRGRLTAFGKRFGAPMNLVLAAELQDYLRDLPTGPRSKNNTRKALKSLFRFAQSRGYLSKGETEAASLPKFKETKQAIGIFTPDEMGRLLAAADADLVAPLALGGFAGLRRAEIMRLDWSEIDLAGGHIVIQANKAKTGSRRLVPISANLRAWLEPRRKERGLVVADSDGHFALRVSQAAAKAEVEWKQNALRHSFISYRVAQTQNVAQVSLEAGNTPQIVFSNYRELVRPVEAEKWFGIVPQATSQPQRRGDAEGKGQEDFKSQIADFKGASGEGEFNRKVVDLKPVEVGCVAVING